MTNFLEITADGHSSNYYIPTMLGFFWRGGGDLQTFNVLINQQYKELDKTGSIDEVTYIVFLLVKNVLIQTIRS